MKRHQRKQLRQLKPLSNYDILNLIEKLHIPHFTNVFMRDKLPRKKSKPKIKECLILNHGSSQTAGTHWTALTKNHNQAYYFDSFGKLPPPLEVIDYLGDDIQLYYNTKKYQDYNTNICGHLCLRFLYDFWRKNA